MFERNLLQRLRNWREKSNRKPLILRGARQVGKTTVVNEFGKEFDNYIHLNLEKDSDAQLFRNTDDVHQILQAVAFRQNISIQTGDTLLFIDEIQNEPSAVALLRYFYEELPNIFVIAAGSRLQTLIKQHISFPVGRVEYEYLFPCTFSEFLGALGMKQYKDGIEQANLPQLAHEEMLKQFTLYTTIGGMPEIVANYAENQDLVALKVIYNTLLIGYNEDVEKYAPTQKMTQIIRHILKTGWNKAGQTIKLGNFGDSNYRSQEVREAFEIMEKAFLLQLVYPTTKVLAPITPSLKRAPKLCWVDTGIVNFATNIQVDLLGKPKILDTWQGHITEHIVAQQLKYALHERYIDDLNFWVRDKIGTDCEVDFIYQTGTKIIPIEVKSGHNSHLRSLHSFINLSQGQLAVRIWGEPFSVDDIVTNAGTSFRLLNIPYYYVQSLPIIIERYL